MEGIIKQIQGEFKDIKPDLVKSVCESFAMLSAQQVSQGGNNNQGGGKKKNNGGDGGGKKNKGGDGGGKKNKGGNKKEEDRAKIIKAAAKEGGKKGQDIEGASAMGGLSFFNMCVETPGDDTELMQIVIDGSNQVVDESDPNAERRGGSGKIGKMLLSCGTNQLVLCFYVPEALQATLTAKEWAESVTALVGGCEASGEYSAGAAMAVGKMNKEKNLYPLKMKDAALQNSIDFLRKKGVFPQDSDDSDDIVFGDDDFDF